MRFLISESPYHGTLGPVICPSVLHVIVGGIQIGSYVTVNEALYECKLFSAPPASHLSTEVIQSFRLAP